MPHPETDFIPGQPLHVRLYGRQGCHLCQDAAQLLSTLHGEFDFWVEKIDIDCRRPVIGSAESADPVEALRRTMSDEIVGSEAFRTEADGIVNDLLAQLPPECRRSLAPDDTGLDLLIGRLANEGSEEVLARLAAGSAQEVR